MDQPGQCESLFSVVGPRKRIFCSLHDEIPHRPAPRAHSSASSAAALQGDELRTRTITNWISSLVRNMLPGIAGCTGRSSTIFRTRACALASLHDAGTPPMPHAQSPEEYPMKVGAWQKLAKLTAAGGLGWAPRCLS